MPSKREVIEQALQQVWDTRNRLTPNDVVEVAADQSHALHGFFEWQDSEAAKEYRLLQASNLIRSVKIKFTVQTADGVEDIKVRRWVAAHRAAPEESDVPEGYMPEEEVRVRPELRAAVLRQMQRDLQNIRRRYSHLTEFWEMVNGMGQEGQQQVG